jgi:ubiquitin-protein ligase
MATARQRLLKEYKEANKQSTIDTGITLLPNENNLFVWKALLQVSSPECSCSSTTI